MASLMARIQRMEADQSAVNRCEGWTNRRGRYKRKDLYDLLYGGKDMTSHIDRIKRSKADVSAFYRYELGTNIKCCY
jgi:hypothetical protein